MKTIFLTSSPTGPLDGSRFFPGLGLTKKQILPHYQMEKLCEEGCCVEV